LRYGGIPSVDGCAGDRDSLDQLAPCSREFFRIIAIKDRTAMTLKVLFIGGTGNISLPCVAQAVASGHHVSVYNRGATNADLPADVVSIVGDRNNGAAYRKLGADHFDVVCQFIAFKPAQVAEDIAAFSGRVGQYIFISSASVYEKPPGHYVMTERTPTVNPYWGYSQDKIAGEAMLKASSGLAWTIVRPSHTMRTGLPTMFNEGDSVGHRMIAGKPVLVAGDGATPWTLTRPSRRFRRPVCQSVQQRRGARRGFPHHVGQCLRLEQHLPGNRRRPGCGRRYRSCAHRHAGSLSSRLGGPPHGG
jgi:uncharacterized protein YbjT (DUF2867 family)